MIVELAIGAAVVTAGSAIARVLWARRGRARRAQAPEPPKPAPRGPGIFPGDVLMLPGAERAASELALERGTDLLDGAFLRILEAIASEPLYVVQLDALGERLVSARPYDALPEGRVADVAAIGERTLALVCRGEAAARPTLEGRPGLLSGRCRFTVLADRGGRHLVVVDPEGGARLCLLGDLLDRRLVDVLPGS